MKIHKRKLLECVKCIFETARYSLRKFMKQQSVNEEKEIMTMKIFCNCTKGKKRDDARIFLCFLYVMICISCDKAMKSVYITLGMSFR